jgi:hypothetical protein
MPEEQNELIIFLELRTLRTTASLAEYYLLALVTQATTGQFLLE